MRTIDVREAQARLSELVEQAALGNAFVITQAGKPLVKVLPALECVKATHRLGFLAGQTSAPDDVDRMADTEIARTFSRLGR